MSDRRHARQMIRAELFGAQNGCCYNCDEPMKLLGRYPDGGELTGNLCTIGKDEDGCPVAICAECSKTRVQMHSVRLRCREAG